MLDQLCTDSVAEALDIADGHHWTRQPPRSDRARLRFLASHSADLATLAGRLNTTPQTLQRLTNQPTHRTERGAEPGHHQGIDPAVAAPYPPPGPPRSPRSAAQPVGALSRLVWLQRRSRVLRRRPYPLPVAAPAPPVPGAVARGPTPRRQRAGTSQHRCRWGRRVVLPSLTRTRWPARGTTHRNRLHRVLLLNPTTCHGQTRPCD